MIQRKDLFSIPFYNKTQYTGSNLGMRYRIEKHVEDDSTTLLATWWPGPYCFTATPDEQKKDQHLRIFRRRHWSGLRLAQSGLYRKCRPL